MTNAPAQEKSRKNKELGSVGERHAEMYLEGLGFSVIDRNVRYKCGEIDIVARKGREIYFFEVKSRTDPTFVDPVLVANRPKLRKVEKAAQLYLLESRNSFSQDDLPPCIIGVIGVDMSGDIPSFELILDEQ